jgi:hypothetical protein
MDSEREKSVLDLPLEGRLGKALFQGETEAQAAAARRPTAVSFHSLHERFEQGCIQ